MIIESLRQLLNSMDYGIEKGNLENAQKDFGEWSRLREQNVVSEEAYKAGIEKAARRIDDSSRQVKAIIDAQRALKAQRDPSYSPQISSSDIVASFLRETPKPRGYNQATMEDSIANQGVINEGWVKTQKPQDIPDEAAMEMSPEELQAASSGYTPPKAEATGRIFAPEGQQLPEGEYNQPPAPEPRKQARKQAQNDFIQVSNTQQRPKTHREVMAEMAPGDAHDYKRNLIFQDQRQKEAKAMQIAGSMYRPGSEEYNRVVSMYQKQIKDSYLPEELKPFDETPLYKDTAKQFEGEKYRQTVDTLARFKEQIEYAKSIKDETQRAQFVIAQMPKMLNTLAAGASDAVGIEEFKNLSPELKNVFDAPPSQWLSLLRDKGIIDMFSRDPDAFLHKVTALYNGGASIINQRTEGANSVLGSHTYKTGAMKLAPLSENIKPGQMSPAQMQGVLEGKFNPTPTLLPVNKADPRKFSVAPVSTFNGPPMKFGTVSGTGVRKFGPPKVDPNELINSTSF